MEWEFFNFESGNGKFILIALKCQVEQKKMFGLSTNIKMHHS